MKTKAFSMLRVSGKSQIEGDGFERQRQCIAEYCKENNIEIEREFLELGVSGTKDAFDRPALSDMLVALKSNGVRLVLFENATRLARDLMVSEVLLNQFRLLNVKVIAADAGTDLTCEDQEPTKVLLRQLLSCISQFEKSCIVNKLRAARVRIKKATGRCEGVKPFGQDDRERAVIARMTVLRGQGMNFTAIAHALNTESGYGPRASVRAGRQTAWFSSSVAKILARQ
ncbi:MAG: recombinase family protein [Verrucomicrobiae bacterium]|nr:recombinase family protein [Verrucomicrobiae bacterium]